MTIAQLKKLLHIGLENPAVAKHAIALMPGGEYLALVNRLQHQPNDSRAVAALMALSKRPVMLGTFFPRSFETKKPLSLYEHGYN